MKQLFFTSTFVLSMLVSLAQTDTLRTKGRRVTPTVIGKWHMDSVSSGLKNSRIIEFNENGQYTETIGDQSQTGMWKIENGALTRDGRTNPIENLTMKRLVVSGMEGKKKVYYYFSKMNYKASSQDVIPH